MKITIIQGSPRQGANTAVVSAFLEAKMSEASGVTAVSMLDIRDFNFPVYGSGQPDAIKLEEFRDALVSADGILIVTPEYNGRVPGALKNTLDFFRAEYAKKPMGVVTVSSGPFGGINAMYDVHDWMMYVGAVPLATKLLVSNVGGLFDETGTPTDFHFNKNYPVFIQDFLWLVGKIMN
jgi:NAD(P)H-dependent FMN reductase